MTARSILPTVCGVAKPDTWPRSWWYECTLDADHAGDHEAHGSDPLVTWPRETFELVVIEPEHDA